MILAMDVGNKNIKFGLFSGGELLNSWRVATNIERTADELGELVLSFFSTNRRDIGDVKGIIIASVIPSINFTLEHMCRYRFSIEPMFVDPGIRTGMKICYDNPRELGADRIANAIAAYELYGGPCIAIDFGTATTFNVINERGDFLGGAICPGIKVASEALVQCAAKLPRVELVKPPSVIGRNMVTGMQSGIIYGYVGQVEYLVQKIRKELNRHDVSVVATGGLARLISTETDIIEEINPLLTLQGLRILYERNSERTARDA
ncbi:MAG: type III pantothenate kinase [Clostridiales bacterium]|nr:type III pantothenate kinase [Clostridiales bacterium]